MKRLKVKEYVGVRGVAMVSDEGDRFAVLDGGPFAWGKLETHVPLEERAAHNEGSSRLALALLLDVFEHDRKKAERYYQRFKLRMVQGWDSAKPWETTSTAILEEIADIDRVTKEMEPYRRQAAASPAPAVSDGGMAPGGGKIEWSK